MIVDVDKNSKFYKRYSHPTYAMFGGILIGIGMIDVVAFDNHIFGLIVAFMGILSLSAHMSTSGVVPG